MVLYPRRDKLNGKEVLVDDTQLVGYREHFTQTHRILFLTGLIGIRCANCGVGEIDSHNLLMALDSLSHDPIRLIITSSGGDLDSAFLFYDTMRLIQSPIETAGRYCSSAAAILLAAGSKRYLFPHAKVMLHLPAGQMGGDARDWDIQHRQMEKYRNKVVDILRECGVIKSPQEILTDIDRDFWMEPQEAIDYGLADEIMTPQIWQSWIKEKIK